MTDSELRSQVRRALDQSMPPLPDDPDLTEAVLERHEQRQQKNRARLSGLRVCVAVAVTLLYICGGAIMQGWSHLITYQSKDGEQYVIRGVSVTPPVSQVADAASVHNGIFSLSTKKLDVVIEILGGTPLLPTWLPDGWEVDAYSLNLNDTMKRLVVSYNKFKPGKKEADRLIYRTTTFSDLEYFYETIEANNEGRYVELENGLSVYVDKNVHRPTSIWQDGLTGYALSGDITEEELLQIIHAMYGLD